MRMFMFIARAMLAASTVLLTTVRASAVDGTPSWFEVDVAAPEPSSTFSSPTLAFDHYGRPSVSWSRLYTIGGTNAVYRSDLLGLGFWSHHLLESFASTGLATSLSFDRAERPFSIWQSSSGSIKYQFNNGATQTLAAGGANANQPLLHVRHDLAGNLRGVYTGAAAGQLFAVNQLGSNYASTSLFTIPGVSQVLDIGLTTDHTGLRHLAARVSLTSGGDRLYVASEPTSGSSAWPGMFLPVAGEVLGMDITTNPETGHPALAYSTFESGANTSRIFYSAFNGITMETTQVQTTTAARFHDLSLAFDISDGRPAIAFERERIIPSPAEELHFAWLNASSIWQSGLVDGSVSLTSALGHLRKPSLAFDDFGTSWPAIAYVDGDGSLNVAFDPPIIPEPATLLLVAVGLLAPRRRRERV